MVPLGVLWPCQEKATFHIKNRTESDEKNWAPYQVLKRYFEVTYIFKSILAYQFKVERKIMD